MAFKFANILKAMGMGSEKEAVTETHLQAADARLAELEQQASAAETRATTAETARTAAETARTEADTARTAAETRATTAEGEATTLRTWKKEQQAADGRTEDDSNTLDDKGTEALEPWERASAQAIANVKKRVGEK